MRLGYAPPANSDNYNYDDGEADDGEGGTPEEHATILHSIFRDFYCPPPWIGWALSALCRGSDALVGDATAGSKDDNDDENNDEGEDKVEVD